MQEMNKDNKPLAPPEPFNEEKMKEMLAKPEVDHVRVFRLKKDDTFKLNGHVYEVTKVMSRGRAIIKQQGGKT